jgi:replication-associated recombination protein RarA
MWPEDLFEYILANLADEIITTDIEIAQPMPCDRWVARSALQKAIRRGETEIALSALASLLNQDPATIWRHLGIIAIEDLGVA